jgi:XTP/dITP diphosphohydrolase
MKIVLATTNSGKIREIQSMAENVEFIGLDQLEAIMPDENGATIDENAVIKSVSIFKQSGLPTLAEDSGLCIDALGGQPGVHSARFAGSTPENMKKVLSLLDGVSDRKAHFETVFAFTDSTGTSKFVGIMNGHIGFEPVGDGGFGYDPIFINQYGKTNAQLTTDEKNKISARGQALREFLVWLSLQY